MTHLESGIIPALRDIKHFEKMLKSKHETVILLETRVSQLADLVAYAKKHAKTVYVHADLVQGLKSDDYGIEFLIRLIQYKNRHKAYRNISFEREAYANEKDLDYLKSRPFWGFSRFVFSRLLS